ncbi:acyltransferase family protein [Ramlibacter sp. AN1133]|uniref:acyltransferase family protein n=1 Tax=Ramlibacter sp. AN1133 TaxID=3133429 RepID=UPI0030C175B4
MRGLEALRGVAATAVAIFHLLALYVPLPEGVARSVILSFGWAVPFFFALSAFSLLWGYHAKVWSEEGLLRFYVRRAFRILPLFYFVLVLLVLFVYGSSITLWTSELVVNLLFMFPFFPGKHGSLVWGGWSLGVEWGFYLLFPFFALIASRQRLSLVVLLVLCILAVASRHLVASTGLHKDGYTVMNFPRNLVFFQSGVFAFVLVRHLRSRSEVATTIAFLGRHSPAILFASALLFVSRIFLPQGVLALLPLEPLVAYACVLWICLAVAGLPRILNNPLTFWLGRHSFGIYLLHPFALWQLSHHGLFAWISAHVSAAGTAFALCAFVSMLVVCAMAAVAYRFVEAPCIEIGDRLLMRRSSSRFLAGTHAVASAGQTLS